MKHDTPTCTNEHVDQPTRPVDAFAHLIASLRRIKRKQAKLSQERKEHEAVIKAALVAAGAEVGTVNGVPVVSFTHALRIALDQNLLKERYPEIAKECADISEVATFRLLGV
ncbi:hypothetical protein NQK81_09005 [Amycolatopsis roodepoortensis]|uniref:hypothetical protein n=1 Tax=Amycolatopsis roodepoortensis TaxID=700274 RepID=UPI00214C01FD|nr:hypothetical protein [Amycolatopsis roodepoortensis]UUV33574.1 hypothetical protein NQK81_09005 [Amycolatopsis roodepoortensis]